MNAVTLQPKFIATLKKKLTQGNARSILLNALPGRIANRLPLTDLDVVQEGLSVQFIKELTASEKFKFLFTIKYGLFDEEHKMKLSRINKRLQNIKYEHDDQQKELGIETFGFGFPIVLRRRKKDINKFVAAPLFIWKLNIYETFKKSGEWCIERTLDHDIRVNEVFASFLENEENIKLSSLPDELLEDNVLDQSEIDDFIKEVLLQLNCTKDLKLNWSVFDKFPDKIASSNYKEDTYLINSGVFGTFKSQKQSIIKEKEKLLTEFNDILGVNVEKAFWDNNHSPVNTDPSQNSVLRSLNSSSNIVIQGPPGTGKSQTLTAIIASALANNKKVLVVCEKRTALEVLESNLVKLLPSLKNSICLIEDVVRDRKKIVETARTKEDIFFAKTNGFSEALKNDINKFENRANELDDQYDSLRKPIVRDLNWANLVSKWLKVERNNGYDTMLREMSVLLNDLTDEDEVLEKVKKGSIIFSEIRQQFSELDKLLGAVYTDNLKSRDLVYSIEQAMTAIRSVEVDIAIMVDIYTGCADDSISLVIHNIINELECVDVALKNAITNNINPKRITIVNRLQALFSHSLKKVILDIRAIPESLGKINKLHKREFGSSVEIDDVHSKLASIKQSVEQLRKRVVLAELNLPITNVRRHTGFDYEKWNIAIEKLKSSIDGLSSVICVDIVDIGSFTIATVQEKTEIFKENLNRAQMLSHLFDNYFEWRRFLSYCNDEERQIIKLISKEAPELWTAKIADAFLYRKLRKEDTLKRFPTDDSTLQILMGLGHDIRNFQKSIIIDNIKRWDTLANNKYKTSGILVKQLYNIRGSKGNNRNTLRSIIQKKFDAFTDFFPVLLMNPTTVTTLLPLQKGLIDTVIFDEASQLRIEDTFSSLIRGKQVIVSGDSQQMPPSNYFVGETHLIDDGDNEIELDDNFENVDPMDAIEMAKVESLLEFAIENGFKETYLDMHYRSRHPDLIEFSNVCFYKSRLLPMPEHSEYNSQLKPITYTHVKGLNINGTNPDECKEIIRLLKEEIDDSKSVGIATFNIQQRNYILRAIGQEREDPLFGKKMTSFDENGFFVKNLENIQGDERDVIILSTTFGDKMDKNFTLNLGPVGDLTNGHRLLNVIITRAKHKLYVITSIPEARISEYKERISSKSKVDGTSGLLAYLDYAKAVSTGDSESKEAILTFIKSEIGTYKVNAINGIGMSESPFEEEVYNWLIEEVDRDRIKQQYPCGGFKIDMVILPKSGKGPKLAIECDGAAYHSDQLSWHHDLYRQKILEDHGFVFYRIWSTNWWRNARGEFKKLMDVISKFDKKARSISLLDYPRST